MHQTIAPYCFLFKILGYITKKSKLRKLICYDSVNNKNIKVRQMKRRTNDQSDKQMTKGTTFNLDQIDRHPILIIESLEGGWTD